MTRLLLQTALIPLLAATVLLAHGAGHAAPAPAVPGMPADRLTFERPRGPVPPPRIRGPRLMLSIREAVSLVLARNFDITIEAYNPRIRENDLTRQRAVFDPALVSDFTASKSKIDTASGLFTGGRPNVSSLQRGSAGVEQKIITGAEYSLLFEATRESTNSRLNLFNPNFETSLTFSIAQPLLRNFGIDVNQTEIRVAAASRDQSLHAYRTRVIEVVDEVEQAYWDLVFAIANLEFRRKSLDLAKDLLRRNRIQVEVGTLAPIEILEAEATVASREDDVIVAEREVRDREDALKKLLNITDDISSWTLRILPSDKPTFTPVELNEMSITMKALRKRADLKSARLEVEKRKLQLRKERQGLLPQLDAVASAGNLAVRDSLGAALDRQFSNKGYFLSGGLIFRIPIGNRDARARFNSARMQLVQAITSQDQLEQAIMEEVRRSVRRVRADRKRIEATRVARRLAEERLDAQEKKFSVGLSTSRDILEDQESLANALTNETKAAIDHNKSLATLDRVTHSTLERFNIHFVDPRAKAPQTAP